MADANADAHSNDLLGQIPAQLVAAGTAVPRRLVRLPRPLPEEDDLHASPPVSRVPPT
jgi:hypothetical protein